MKLTNQQIDTLVQKVIEIQEEKLKNAITEFEVEKEFKSTKVQEQYCNLKELQKSFKKLNFNYINLNYSYSCIYDYTDLEERFLDKIKEKMEKNFKQDNFKNKEQIKNEIILLTIEASNIDEILNHFK